MEAGGEEFSPSVLSLFRFHLFPFSPETPDTQASPFQISVRGLWHVFGKLSGPKYPLKYFSVTFI